MMIGNVVNGQPGGKVIHVRQINDTVDSRRNIR